MTNKQVRTLSRDGVYSGQALAGKIEETHISWVILSGQDAFKLKKPVKLPFLDFSTLRLRKKFCEREVILNRRLTDIYHGVLPVRGGRSKYTLGSGQGKIIDYAVHMVRLASGLRMDNLLRKKEINDAQIRSIAKQIAGFHSKAVQVNTAFRLGEARKLFNDIQTIADYVDLNIGRTYKNMIDASCAWSDSFLKSYAVRFQERIVEGYKRDVHGDLHSGNIFIYRKPVIFDCIEFNDRIRQVDVLYEIAFLCMDLEAFGEKGLSRMLLEEYCNKFNCLRLPEDHAIFNYYKCLRANIRAKVHIMSAHQAQGRSSLLSQLKSARTYFSLMRRYMK